MRTAKRSVYILCPYLSAENSYVFQNTMDKNKALVIQVRPYVALIIGGHVASSSNWFQLQSSNIKAYSTLLVRVPSAFEDVQLIMSEYRLGNLYYINKENVKDRMLSYGNIKDKN